MDIETENVINLVFPESIPGGITLTIYTWKLIVNILFNIVYMDNYIIFVLELWKENPEFYQYLLKLGGFDVDQLSKDIFISSL